MGLNCFCKFQPFLPWICTSVALGYAAYLHWRLRQAKEANKKQILNKDKLNAREEVNIDDVDRSK